MHIARLREKLRDDQGSPRIVLTVRGQGYMLAAGEAAMKRLGAVWLIFGLCVALAAGAMARLGATALALERAEAKARRQAALEENLQLALWRMDSALAAADGGGKRPALLHLQPALPGRACLHQHVRRDRTRRRADAVAALDVHARPRSAFTSSTGPTAA